MYVEKRSDLPRTPHPLGKEASVRAAFNAGQLLYSQSAADIAEFCRRYPDMAARAWRDVTWWDGVQYEVVARREDNS